MRSIVVLIFFFTVSFGELDFNSKLRNFSVEIFYHAVQDADQDVMLSPYAIWSLFLSLTYETSGVTREQFVKVLSLADDKNEVLKEFQKLKTSLLMHDQYKVIITSLNYFFYDENCNVSSDGIRRLENDFGFITKRLNFKDPQRAVESVRKIKTSHGDTLALETEEDFVDTAMIMATFFSCSLKWLNSLNWEKVIESKNYINHVLLYVKAPLRFSSFDSLHANVTELPYRGDYCMLRITPHRGYNVKQVIINLREVSLEHVLAKLQSDSDELGLKEVDVYLPVDPINIDVNLQKILVAMGLSGVFDQDSAGFNNFAGDDIYIGEISHTAGIIFETSMTTGYAITPEINAATQRSREEYERSSIFFIMHKSTATVLLAGFYTEFDLL